MASSFHALFTLAVPERIMTTLSHTETPILNSIYLIKLMVIPKII